MQIEHPCQIRFGIFLCCPWPLHSNNKLILLQVKLFPSLFAFGHEILDVWRPLISNICLLSVLKKHKVLAIKGILEMSQRFILTVFNHACVDLQIISNDISELQKNQATTVAKIAQYKRKLMDLSHRVLQVAVSLFFFLLNKPFRHPYISVKLRVTVGAQNSLFT